MKRALEVLNDLENQGLIGRYAIGGAMAAVFYTEPVATFDLDIFLVLQPSTAGLISLAPLYEALARLGYAASGECVDIGGVPVQFLPAYDALVEEALGQAAEIAYEGVPTRVLRAEHLVAIALKAGRPKDRIRVQMLKAQASLDPELLEAILGRHGLVERWRLWTR